MNLRAMGAVGLVAGFALAGCETLPTSGLVLDLVGEWEWEQSVGGIAGVTNTPQSVGYTQRLIFRSDSSVDLMRNGALVKSVTFTVLPLPDAGQWDVTYSEPTIGFEMQRAEVRSNLLILTDPCCDGFVSRFNRVR